MLLSQVCAKPILKLWYLLPTRDGALKLRITDKDRVTGHTFPPCGSVPVVDTVNVPIIVKRGRLDKSHSTPAYDNSGEDSDTPPAIEPRKDFLIITPPVPPPRPKKPGDSAINVPVPPPKPPGLLAAITVATTNSQSVQPSNPGLSIQATQDNANEESQKPFLFNTTTPQEPANEASGELQTPTKTRSLTLKKKHSLISKRRNVNLKVLGTGDIQASTSNCLNEISSKDLFSENESSGEENESVVSKHLCTPSPQGTKDIQPVSVSSKASSAAPTPTKSDRRYLGSLRKLTKGTLPFKSSNSSDKKQSNDIPVPTDQFRSYRKVPGGSFAIQIGANTPGYHDTSMHPFNSSPKTCSDYNKTQQIFHQTQTSPEIAISPTPEQVSQCINKRLTHSSSRCSIASTSESATIALGPPSSPAPVPGCPSSFCNVILASTSTINCLPQSPAKLEINQQSTLTSPSKA
ncbi:hypothetical protein EVAR_70700_1 [Eumeta japonica]|uniref:Uncharacterized protein n=1 Tax=Eumeta variegata TaxID=151549 RepID=A0A4C2A9R2_EUMVA|nr:hypothetical protein EVAR_70700_1 [Eumeta japonica]